MISSNKSLEEEHTAAPQNAGYDYQFYYFIYLLLDFRFGQKIGYEVKEDVHIDYEDGTTILFQTKHTVVKDKLGKAQNLTSLDIDLWKTLHNWANFIKGKGELCDEFLSRNSFILITNKSENNNKIINSISNFKKDGNVDAFIGMLNKLKEETESETIKKYIKTIVSLGKKKLKIFLYKIYIETGVDEIQQKIKNRISEKFHRPELVDPIFEKFSGALLEAKYFDTLNNKSFEITYDDFTKRFGRCFQIATKPKPLPIRELKTLLPENLENQIFIRQLIDIGEVESGSDDIVDYTVQMLSFLNNFNYWLNDEDFILQDEADGFKRNSIVIWKNEFKSRYRKIRSRIKDKVSIDDLSQEINEIGIELVDYIRKQDLSISDFPPLGIELSNGHYYALSNSLDLGWHLDWESKYLEK